MNEEQLFVWGLGLFMLGTYGAVLGFSLSSGKAVWPYVGLICLHLAAGVRLWIELDGVGRSGGDAAGNGMAVGFAWLAWIAVNVCLALVALATFFVRRLRA